MRGYTRGGFKGVAYDNGGLLDPIGRTFNAYAAEAVLTLLELEREAGS